MLKKLILNPQRDTITICIPAEWVGQPLTCILKTANYVQEEIYAEVSEDAICYQRIKYRHRRRTRGNVGKRRC